MIKLKDLDNRIYNGKVCTEFSYSVQDNEGQQKFRAFYQKGQKDGEWLMSVVLNRTRVSDSQVYSLNFIMPKPTLPLELVAATGLKYLQLCLKEEIQTKSDYDFILGDILKDM